MCQTELKSLLQIRRKNVELWGDVRPVLYLLLSGRSADVLRDLLVLFDTRGKTFFASFAQKKMLRILFTLQSIRVMKNIQDFLRMKFLAAGKQKSLAFYT